MGKPMGVVHATGPDGEPASREAIAALETVASVASSRITLLRSMARTQLQAAIDQRAAAPTARPCRSR
jgi:hypothetical protein